MHFTSIKMKRALISGIVVFSIFIIFAAVASVLRYDSTKYHGHVIEWIVNEPRSSERLETAVYQIHQTIISSQQH